MEPTTTHDHALHLDDSSERLSALLDEARVRLKLRGVTLTVIDYYDELTRWLEGHAPAPASPSWIEAPTDDDVLADLAYGRE